MIERKTYLDKLSAWKDEKVIKVITGIRRCGKSTLLKQMQERLIKEGVTEDQIISINFEDLENEALLEYKALYASIQKRLCLNRMTYIFLDEIQRVKAFEKVVDSLYLKDNVDIYMTGSNAYLLSSDLATLLTGRYVEISLLPLSFKEVVEAQKPENLDQAFLNYMRNGGFPYLATVNKTSEKAPDYLEGILNTVVVKDIEERQNQRNDGGDRRKTTDAALLLTIARYLASVVGSPVSAKKVTDTLISSGRKISPNTVSDYMEALSEAFIFYKADRFDVVGKQLLKVNAKWYLVDLGLRTVMLPRKNYDLGFSIENIVYLELLRRRYRVYIGKLGNTEIDFVAQKQDIITYIQVTANMTAEETFNREMKPLQNIQDNYEKIVLTLDRFTPGNYNGIKVVNVIDWLLEESNAYA